MIFVGTTLVVVVTRDDDDAVAGPVDVGVAVSIAHPLNRESQHNRNNSDLAW